MSIRHSLIAVVSVCFLALILRLQLTQPEDANTVAAQDKEKNKDVPPEQPKGFTWVIAPYVQFPTTTSMVVMFETTEACTGVVEYGSDLKQLDKKAELKEANDFHEVKLSDLTPETKYIYKISLVSKSGAKLEIGPLQFATAVKADSAYSFAVIGDTQRNPKVTAQVAKRMYERRPNFVIHCGDVVDSGPSKVQWTDDLFKPCSELFARVACFPCIGNHEKNHAFYYKYFSMPAPKYYYKYTYGNAEFFVIDTNKSVKPDSEQFKWLDAELSKSKATWKFAYHHHPVYSSDDNDYGDTWKGPGREGDLNARNLSALYEKYNVDINFNGHIHLYERSWPLKGGKVDRKNGVIYVTSGGGGGSLENFAPTPTWFKKQCRVDFHFCLVNIQGKSLEFKAFDKDGILFDSFEVEK